MTEYTDEYLQKKMEAMMAPMEAAFKSCKDRDEVLMLASAMMGYSKTIFEAMVGVAGTRNLMESMLPEVPAKE